MSDHFHITFEASFACPCPGDTNAFTSRQIKLTVIATLNEKLPGVLAPFATATESGEKF